MKTRKVKTTQKGVDEQTQSEITLPKGNLPPPEPVPEYKEDFKVIDTYITEVNVEKEWKEIREWIRRRPVSLQVAMIQLAEQPNMNVRSKRLHLVAKRELKRFENEWKDRTQILRELGRDYWETKKKSGMKKQITESMVDDWILEHYGDTWKELHIRLQDMKNTTALLETLADTVQSKAPDLRKLCDILKEKRQTQPSFMDGQERKGKR